MVILAVTLGWTRDAGAQSPEPAEPVTEPTAAEEAATNVEEEGAEDGEGMILDPISVTATRNPIKAFEYPGMAFGPLQGHCMLH